jgi:hypothetical protein
MIKMDNVQLPCDHLKDGVPCWQAQDISKIKYDILVEKRVPDCGHFVKTQCSQDVASKTFSCSTLCGAYLPCGHICPGSCGRCRPKDTIWSTAKHQKCAIVCGRRFGTCNHTCPRACHGGDECGPCPLACGVRGFNPPSNL